MDKTPGTNQPLGNLGKQYPFNILVAEDNVFNQKLILIVLKKLGYIPTLVKNGKEAKDILATQNFDLILMDVEMPIMDGLDATRAIRLESAIEQPIIVGVTANSTSSDRLRCIDAGMNKYISKPFSLQKIRDVITEIAEEQQQKEEDK